MLIGKILLIFLINEWLQPIFCQYLTAGRRVLESKDRGHVSYYVTEDVDMLFWFCHAFPFKRDWAVAPYDCLQNVNSDKIVYIAFFAIGQFTRTFIPVNRYQMSKSVGQGEGGEKTYLLIKLLFPLPKNNKLYEIYFENLSVGMDCEICGVLDKSKYLKLFPNEDNKKLNEKFPSNPAVYCVDTSIINNSECGQLFSKGTIWDTSMICTKPKQEMPEVIVTDTKAANLLCQGKLVGLMREEWSQFDNNVEKRMRNLKVPIGFLRLSAFQEDFSVINSEVDLYQYESSFVSDTNRADEKTWKFMASVKHAKQHIMSAVLVRPRFLLGFGVGNSVYNKFVSNVALFKLVAEIDEIEYKITYISVIKTMLIFILDTDVQNPKFIEMWDNVHSVVPPQEKCFAAGRPNIFSATAEQASITETHPLIKVAVIIQPHTPSDRIVQTRVLDNIECIDDNSVPLICRGYVYGFTSWDFFCFTERPGFWSWATLAPVVKEVRKEMDLYNQDVPMMQMTDDQSTTDDSVKSTSDEIKYEIVHVDSSGVEMGATNFLVLLGCIFNKNI